MLRKFHLSVRSSSGGVTIPNWITQRLTRQYKGPARLDATVSLDAGAGLFLVDPRSGQVQLRSVILDFETKPSLTLDVFMIDNGSPPLSVTTSITIKVIDVNEPPALNDQTLFIEENKPKYTPLSANVAAGDPDQDEELSFEFVNNKAGIFVIEACNGKITLNKPVIDYE